jgi:hypothetical protein
MKTTIIVAESGSYRVLPRLTVNAAFTGIRVANFTKSAMMPIKELSTTRRINK